MSAEQASGTSGADLSAVARACRRVRALGTSPSFTKQLTRASQEYLCDLHPEGEQCDDRDGYQLAALALTLRDLLCGEGGLGGVGALELLELLEWPYTYRGDAFCRVCRGKKYDGHESYCALAAYLRRAAEELGATEEGGGS